MSLRHRRITILILTFIITSIDTLPTPSHIPSARTFSTPESTNIPPNALNLTARSPTPLPGIYICPLPDWTGHCFWTIIPPSQYGTCGSVTALDGWDAVGPDKGITVDVFTDVKCNHKLNGARMTWPGVSDLKRAGMDNGNVKYFGVKVWDYGGAYPGDQ